MSSFTLTPEIRKAFADLGWSDLPTDLHPYSAYRSDAEPSFFVRAVRMRGYRYGSHPTKITVGCDYKDARGMDEIKPHTIDTAGPKWVQSLFRWHAVTTFKLVEIRAKHLERDRTAKLWQDRRDAHASELKSITGDTGWLVAGGSHQDGSYSSIRFNLTLINRLNENLSVLPINDAAKRGGEMLALLKAHGFLT
jgi:hypothetical protein